MVRDDAVIYVVDDDQAVRDSLRWLLESVELNVETCESAQAFLDVYDRDRPGCLLLDVRMPGTSGLELQQQLADQQLSIPIIIITGHGDVQMAVRAMRDGAVDFVEKPFNDQMLLDRVRDAVEKDIRVRRQQTEQLEIRKRLDRLTPRERDVLELIVAGRLTKQIAAELGVSEKTVEVHRSHIMAKTQAKNVAGLVRMTMMAREADEAS